MRRRICSGCGKQDIVRSDNPATKCKKCASSRSLEKGRKTKSENRNFEICHYCGTDFPSPPSNRQKFCSMQCRRAGLHVDRICKTCGVAFRVRKTAISEKTNASGNFCSRGCYEIHMCKTERVNGRGSRWSAIRKEALRRTPFCATCGKTRRLQVHHIIPYRLTMDNTQSNLVPLCISCHKSAESIFHDLEAENVPLDGAKAMLFFAFMERRMVTAFRISNLIGENNESYQSSA